MPTAPVTPGRLNSGITDDGNLHEITGAPGLLVANGFLTPEQQAECAQMVDANQQAWRNDLRRRVQHHGWRYDHRTRAITPDMHLGRLPDHLQNLAQRIFDEPGTFDRVPEQVIINEYMPGQGMGTRIDHPGFGPAVCTISLLDD